MRPSKLNFLWVILLAGCATNSDEKIGQMIKNLEQQQAAQTPPAQEQAPPPPTVQPYVIPRFDGEQSQDFRYVPPIKKSKNINPDAIFTMVVNCFPERPKWGIEIKGQAGLRQSESNQLSSLDTDGLARHYVGIVAQMPLYSPDETYRQQEQERRRRQEVAENIASFMKGLADRDRALREIGIWESVEARSQLRVQQGLAPAEEQIGYLEKVAKAHADYATANAAITSSRIALSGQCRDSVSNQVNQYLSGITQ